MYAARWPARALFAPHTARGGGGRRRPGAPPLPAPAASPGGSLAPGCRVARARSARDPPGSPPRRREAEWAVDRFVTLPSLLPDVTQDFAAEVQLPGLLAGHGPAGSGEDCQAEPAQNARDLGLASVDPQSRLADSLPASPHPGVC